MFSLLALHFDGVTRAQFEADLATKQWIVALRRESRLVGFSTLRVANSVFDAEPITVIYSGDTIVAPEAWGTPALARAWIAAVEQIRATPTERRCFWLLLTSGFRTYRFLPVFWREFFPRFDAATPPAMAALMAHLAREGYGAAFDACTGRVKFPHPQTLRGPLAEVPLGRNQNPHVAFFLRQNPGYILGDELVCLTEISARNLTNAGRRMIATPTR